MRYATAGAFRTALETRLLARSRTDGTDLERLRRSVVFERLLVRLEAAHAARWVVKGGTALELRLPARARATKDLDVAVRETFEDAEALREVLVESLSEDPEGDWFEFRVGRIFELDVDEPGRPGRRVQISAFLGGRPFATVRIDIVTLRHEIAETERVALPGLLGFAGLPPREVEVIGRSQHFAEKLHAYTRDYAGRASSRVRDLVDMVLLIDDGLEPTRELTKVVERLFEMRGTHPVPTAVPDPPEGWGPQYEELAMDREISARALDEAIARLRAFWAKGGGV